MTVAKIVTAHARLPALKLRQTRKMARSAYAYVRGSTAKFYEWLGEHRAAVPEGPPIWICGDCHAGNLGPIGGPDGRVLMQIRDLDQTVIGNPAHDIIRLALSLATASRGSDLPGVMVARIMEQIIQGYQRALVDGEDREKEMPQAVSAAMRQSTSRTWKHLARERLEGSTPTIPLGAKFWPLSAKERSEVRALFNINRGAKIGRLLALA